MRTKLGAGRRGRRGGSGGASSVHVEGADHRPGVKAGGQRTWNMDVMSVTLDVSKRSGWLYADASCETIQGRGVRIRTWRGTTTWGGGGGGASGMHTLGSEGPTAEVCGG